MIKSDGTARMNPIILFNMKKECDPLGIDRLICTCVTDDSHQTHSRLLSKQLLLSDDYIPDLHVGHLCY